MRSLIRRRGGDLFLHVERVWHDVRHGARVFVRNPALTASAVLSIACGTGANGPDGAAPVHGASVAGNAARARLSAVTASALVGMVPIESRLTAGVYWFVVPVVIAVTSLAAAIPARHAARINPTVALRCE